MSQPPIDRLPRSSLVVELAGGSINRFVTEWLVGDPNLLHIDFVFFRRLILFVLIRFLLSLMEVYSDLIISLFFNFIALNYLKRRKKRDRNLFLDSLLNGKSQFNRKAFISSAIICCNKIRIEYCMISFWVASIFSR